MDEQPATGVDEEAAVALGEVAFTSLDVLHVQLAGGEEVNSGDGSVADGDETLVSLHIHSGEAIEVLKEGSIRGSHGELDLGELGEDTEESHLGLSHDHLAINLGAALACEHFLLLSNLIIIPSYLLLILSWNYENILLLNLKTIMALTLDHLASQQQLPQLSYDEKFTQSLKSLHSLYSEKSQEYELVISEL